MKISKLSKFAGVTFALVLGTSTLFAQGFGNGNGNGNGIRMSASYNDDVACVDNISGLTQDQVGAINNLEARHQEQMDVLREDRRSTSVQSEKDEIRVEMLEVVAAHRTNVKSLLNEEQQKEFDLLHLEGGNHLNQRQGGNGLHEGNGSGNHNRTGSSTARHGSGNHQNSQQIH